MTSKEAKEYLISLVDRDTPMKVVKEVVSVKTKKEFGMSILEIIVDGKEFYERDIYRCGSCNNVLIVDRYQRLEDKDKIKYCSKCGQRLDWSENKLEKEKEK